MKDMDQQILRGLEIPSPPPELRARTLQAAKAALAQPVADFWSRVWHNRRFRLAWAACSLALIACHLLISLPSRPETNTLRITVSDQEIRDIIDLPRIDTHALSPSAALAASAEPSAQENPS